MNYAVLCLTGVQLTANLMELDINWPERLLFHDYERFALPRGEWNIDKPLSGRHQEWSSTSACIFLSVTKRTH